MSILRTYKCQICGNLVFPKNGEPAPKVCTCKYSGGLKSGKRISCGGNYRLIGEIEDKKVHHVR